MTMHPMSQPDRNAEIRRLVFTNGATMKEAAKRYGVTESRIGQILDNSGGRRNILSLLESNSPLEVHAIARTLSMDDGQAAFYVESLRKHGEVVVSPEGAVSIPTVDTNQKLAILRALVQHGPQPTLEQLADTMRLTGGPHIDPHNLHHVLWSLQKQGYVTFRDKSNGQARQLRNIEITAAGERWLAGKMGVKPELIKEHEAIAPVLALQNGDTAEITTVITMPNEGEPVIERQTIEMKPGSPTVLVDEQQPDGSITVTTAPEPEPLADYPLVRDLVVRHARYKLRMQAAKLLEEAGDDELALSVLERDTLTPLEEEVVELLRRIV